MQQEKRRRVLRTGLSVEDGEPIYLCCAIKRRVLHGTSPSLGLGQQLRRWEHYGNRQRHAADLQASARMGRAEKAHRLPPLTAGRTKRFCPIEVLHVLLKIALKFAEASFCSDANSLRAYAVSSFVSNTRMKVFLNSTTYASGSSVNSSCGGATPRSA